jgi:MSHA biogenesis protein MshJ
MMNIISRATGHYNTLVLRERVLLIALACSVVFFIWYVFWGYPASTTIEVANNKREKLLTLSESIVSKYGVSEEQQTAERNRVIIDKRMSSVRSKMTIIDDEIKQFNEKTIPIGEVILLLRDLLTSNKQLSVESLKVYPSELIKENTSSNDDFEDAFEKSMISLTLKGSYASIFDYLKKVEALKWSVFWEDVEYSVDQYPIATVTIQLYTLSIIEEDRYATQ